jgi:hypothetical protein
LIAEVAGNGSHTTCPAMAAQYRGDGHCKRTKTPIRVLGSMLYFHVTAMLRQRLAIDRRAPPGL